MSKKEKIRRPQVVGIDITTLNPPTLRTKKTVGNTTSSGAKVNVKDIVFWGDGDTFKLISKASSKAEGWLKSTKAMQIDGVGCVVQVTTQQGDNVAEAVTFVPKVKIQTIMKGGEVVSRKLVGYAYKHLVTLKK